MQQQRETLDDYFFMYILKLWFYVHGWLLDIYEIRFPYYWKCIEHKPGCIHNAKQTASSAKELTFSRVMFATQHTYTYRYLCMHIKYIINQR